MAKKLTGKFGSKKFNLNYSNNRPRLGSTGKWSPLYTPEEISKLKMSARREAKRQNKQAWLSREAQLAANQTAQRLKYATINNAITQVGANQLADTATMQATMNAMNASQNVSNKPQAPTGSTNVGSSATDSTNSMDWIK